jgi:hypothetical protein
MFRFGFLLFWIAALTFSVLAEGKKYGLFVGISDYKSDLLNLPSSINDATGMCNVFSPNCNTGDAELLLDKEATRDNILNGIRTFQAKVSKGDLFLFYYSGHGVLFPDRGSEMADESFNVVIESPDQKPQKPKKSEQITYDTALVPYDSNDGTGKRQWKNLILDDELFSEFVQFTNKGARVVVVSDSCNSGGLAKSLFKPLGNQKFMDLKSAIGVDEKDIQTASIRKESHPEDNLNGLYLLIAASEERSPAYSQNPSEKINSLFTYFLIKKILEYKSAKKIFTCQDVLTGVKPEVEKSAKANGSVQTPMIDTRFYNGSLDTAIF